MTKVIVVIVLNELEMKGNTKLTSTFTYAKVIDSADNERGDKQRR